MKKVKAAATKKKRKEIAFQYYIHLECEITGGEVINPEEEWSSRKPCYKTNTFIRVSNVLPLNHRHSYEYFANKECLDATKEVYAIIVIYSDGDTFGTYHGRVQVWSAHTTQEAAEKALKAIPSSQEYKCWEGYFSSLEDMRIEKLPYFHVLEQRQNDGK